MRSTDRPRDPKQIVLEAELLVSPPERIRAWLEESIQQKNFKLHGRDEKLERALLARNEPLITLSLARLASTTTVMREIMQGPASQDKPLRLAALMNEVVAKVGITGMPHALFEPGDGQLERFMAPLDLEEVLALFGNPTLENDFLIDFFEQKNSWQVLDDTRRFAALRALQDNSRMRTAYKGPYDGYGEYLHNKVFSAAWELAGRLPATPEWAAHLCWLYGKLPASAASLKNPLQLAARWVPDPADAKRIEAESDDLRRGYLGVFARTRKGLARLSVAAAHSADARRALSAHDDAAVRAAYYFEGDMSLEEMKQADERDPMLSFEEMMWNPLVWRTKERRDQLHAMAWDSKRDPKSYMDPQNMFNARRDAYREQYPEWFKDDDENGGAEAPDQVEEVPSQEVQRLDAIGERVAEIHQELIKPPKTAWPGGAIAAGLLGGVLFAVFQAFCIATLWGWFVAPVFHVAEMSVVVAFGISMLISIFQDPSQQYKDKEWTEIIGMMIGRAAGLGFALLLGWILHFYV